MGIRWLALATLLAASNAASAVGDTLKPTPAPPLPASAATWLGTPVSWSALRGRVVLLNVWTFG
jgi:hypothetical protein